MSSNNSKRELLDVGRLDAWMLGQGLKAAGTIDIEKLAVGRSNEMFVLRFTDASGEAAEAVLRRPAGVAWEKAANSLRREYQLMSALAGRGVPVPAAIAICENEDVLGALFYLMKKVDGFIPAMGAIPASFTGDEALVRQTAFAGLDAIAAIHSVDWKAVGLAGYGKPDNFHERQVGRWTAQLESYGGRELPGLKRIGDWLQQNLPSRWTPTIMHGDYHPLNLLMSNELPPAIAAIVDWETSTIGDPFLDLVGYLDIWYDANGGIDWPDYDEMVDYYLSRVDFEPENMDYYRLLYSFRQSVLLEGIYQRSLSDDTREDMVEMAEHVDRLIAKALMALEKESGDE